MIRSFLQQRASWISVLVLGFSSLWTAGCGDHSSPTITISPATSQVRAGDTLQFTADVIGLGEETGVTPRAPVAIPGPRSVNAQILHAKPNSGTGSSNPSGSSEVNWSVNGVAGGNATFGTINNTGLYTAPAVVPTAPSITVTATSEVNSLVSGEAVLAPVSYTHLDVYKRQPLANLDPETVSVKFPTVSGFGCAP